MILTDRDQVVRIVDLGCSSGPNTIRNVEAVIEQVRARYREAEVDTSSGPEIQVYFQDLPNNDFNTLIKYQYSQPRSDEEKIQKYMSAAVPGSFYDRLFPKSTINIALSTFALHWLSEIPAAVRDKASPAYNGGNTQIDRSSLATKEAYAEQAKKDLDSFLAARAHEIGPGGLLFLVFLTRPDEQSGAILLEDGEEDVWDSMVLEGVVPVELRDDFNTPIYYRDMDEINTQLESYGSVFEVQKRDVHMLSLKNFLSSFPDPRDAARVGVNAHRAVFIEAMDAYIGESASRIYFQKCEEVLGKLYARKRDICERDGSDPALAHLAVLSLRRK
ncbi:hypothetical protein MPTK2_3g90190P [Marchantia polymorpha subsp. ruderalis]